MNEMKRISILGATGSIGTQTLDIVRQMGDRFQVVSMAANTNEISLQKLATEFGVSRLALAKEGASSSIPSGLNALSDMVTSDDVDLVVVAIAGAAAIVPTVAAIEAGKSIALASKEVLVAAGEWVMPLVAKHGTRFTPIDSEHSAIFQCLQGYSPSQVSKIILTASGGPFRGFTRDQLSGIKPEQALKHPNWSMGAKITIDSASMMNKALETIEARWLFGLDLSQVEVLVHPQSIIHSMVEFADTSVIGQLGWPDMRLPIQYALTYPERVPNELKPWNPVATGPLTFEELDEDVFPAIRLARHADAAGGTLPAVFNAANEAAVAQFLNGQLSFLGIADTVQNVMNEHSPSAISFEAILEADQWARIRVEEIASA